MTAIATKSGHSISAPAAPVIEMSFRQRGNPLLKFITHLRLQESNMPFDYRINSDIGVLFLSLKYHRINPGYIMSRLNSLRGVRIKNPFLIIQVDVSDPANAIGYLTMATFSLGYRILLSWSPKESATIIEILFFDGNKGLEFISNKKQTTTHLEDVRQVLACIKGLNSTDAVAISKRFKNFKSLINYEDAEMKSIPGLGKTKLLHMERALRGNFF